ncbi:MAG TPA: TolC family protein [Puia sp.]
MQRGKLVLAGVFFLFLFQYKAIAQTATDSGTVYTLQQCIDSAIKNNIPVNQADFTMRGARLTSRQQWATMLPNISASASYGSNAGKSINNFTNTYVNQQYGSGSGQINGSWVIFNAFSIQNFIKSYSLLYEANKADYQQAKDQATVNVILAYISVLSSKEQLSAARTQVEASRRRAALMKIQNDEGAIAPSDYTDIKGQLAADELTVVNQENALENNKLLLAQLMNIPYSPNLNFSGLAEGLTPAPYTSTVDQIYQNALTNLALVQSARLHMESAEKLVKATHGTMYPTLSAQAQVNTNYSTVPSSIYQSTTNVQTNSFVKTAAGETLYVVSPQDHYTSQKISFKDQFDNNRFTYVGLNLSIPILQGLNRRTNYKQAQVQRDLAAFTQKTTITQLKQNVESYYVQMNNNYRLYNTMQIQVENYQASYDAAGIKFDAGAMKSLDFIIYKTNIDRARINLIQAKYNYILQTKVLDYFQGKLTW